MTQDELQRRIESLRGTHQSNCIGTALYLAGLENVDEVYDTDIVYYKILKDLRKTDNPQRGTLVAWLNHNTSRYLTICCHMGVIIKQKPLTLAHRPGLMRELQEEMDFSQLNSHCGFPDLGTTEEREIASERCILEVTLYNPKTPQDYKPRTFTAKQRREIIETFEEPCS